MPPERQRGQDEAAREGRAAASGAKPGGARDGSGSERDGPAASAPAHQEGARKRSWPTEVQRVFSRQRAIGAEGLSGRGRLTSLAPRPRYEGGEA